MMVRPNMVSHVRNEAYAAGANLCPDCPIGIIPAGSLVGAPPPPPANPAGTVGAPAGAGVSIGRGAPPAPEARRLNASHGATLSNPIVTSPTPVAASAHSTGPIRITGAAAR